MIILIDAAVNSTYHQWNETQKCKFYFIFVVKTNN